jgi:hypothetical protein
MLKSFVCSTVAWLFKYIILLCTAITLRVFREIRRYEFNVKTCSGVLCEGPLVVSPTTAASSSLLEENVSTSVTGVSVQRNHSQTHFET